MTKKIERQDIVSDKAIKNVKLLSYEIDKLDDKLEKFANKYNIPYKSVWQIIQFETNYK